MEKFFKIVGIIVVACIALGLVGWLVGFLIKAVFWIAVIAGVLYIVSTFALKNKRKQINK